MADFFKQLISALEPKIQSLGKSLEAAIKRELRTVMLEVAAPEIKALFLDAYDKLAEIEESEMGAAVRGKDPLSLKNLRTLFEEQIQNELTNKVRVDDSGLVLNLLDEDLLGYNGTHEDVPISIDVLNFYIEGVPDEYAFITPEQYEARGRRSSQPLGRVGGGFLMPKKRYESERWAEVTRVPFSEVRHAISAQKPYKGFQEAAAKINFGKYVREAVRRAAKSLG